MGIAMTNGITLYIEPHSRIPFITTDSVELINILKITLNKDLMDYLLNDFIYPNVTSVTLSDIRMIKESVESVGLTLDIIEIETVSGSWKKGVEFFLSGKTYVGRRV